ncbi:MAG: hypothetical protein E6Q67_12955 [Roseateles sp.]|nr:MAG: hypothetical protein E6Q67_12955 [Roseateles sp.]
MAVELLLFGAAPVQQPATLLFGQTEDDANAQAALDITLAPPTLSAQVSTIGQARLDVSLAPPTLDVRAVDAELLAQVRLAASLPAPTLSARLVDAALLRTATLDVQLGLPSLHAVGQQAQAAHFFAMLRGPSMQCSAVFQLNVDRPIVGMSRAAWQGGVAREAGVQLHHQAAVHLQASAAPRWQGGQPCRAGAQSRQPGDLQRVRSQAAPGAQAALLRRSSIASVFGAFAGKRADVSPAFAGAEIRRAQWMGSFKDRDRCRASIAARVQSGEVRRVTILTAHRGAVGRHLVARSGYQDGIAVPPGYGYKPPVVQPPGPCYTPSAELLFVSPAATNGDLLFVCDRHSDGPGTAPIVIPSREVYMVTNAFSLALLDGTPVPAHAASLMLDADSWTWGFSATLPGAALPLVEPGLDGPVELLATVNGTAFHFIVEQVSRERTFGQAGIRISGRGRNALLDAPYAPNLAFTNNGLRTTQQLMAEVLTMNGAALGWAVDWRLEDWIIPTGVFSHQGTYISALTAIAAAGGGYLQPHTSQQSISVLPRYPSAPWEWADLSPDLVLPADLVTRESMTWREKPAYNRVYVSGQAQGVLGSVTRAGTAGDLLAPMVVDQLITSAAAARQRGLSVLADTGRQIDVGLSLPVLPETGVVRPGQLIEYLDGDTARRGLVRSVDVAVDLPDITQTLGVEIHA